MVCRVIDPRDAHVLISKTWDSVRLYTEKDFEDGNKALELESIPWIILAVPYNHKGLRKEGAAGSDSEGSKVRGIYSPLVALKDGAWGREPGNGDSLLRLGKAGNRLSPGIPRRKIPANTLI